MSCLSSLTCSFLLIYTWDNGKIIISGTTNSQCCCTTLYRLSQPSLNQIGWIWLIFDLSKQDKQSTNIKEQQFSKIINIFLNYNQHSLPSPNLLFNVLAQFQNDVPSFPASISIYFFLLTWTWVRHGGNNDTRWWNGGFLTHYLVKLNAMQSNKQNERSTNFTKTP
jgi:hypothetical protein